MENINNVNDNNNLDVNSDLNNLENSQKDNSTNSDIKTFNSDIKTFTQEEVDKIISKRLAREKKDIEEKIEKERKEAEELAKLSEAEKQKRLFEKEKAEFEETKKAYEREKLLNETQKQLSLRSLPISMARHLVSENAESTLENINEFEKDFNSALEKMVNERLKGNTLKSGTTKMNNSSILSKEQFNKMSYKERMKIFEEDRELYNSLTK